MAKVQHYPETASSNQFHPWFDQVEITDVEPLVKQQYLRRGYYASVAYLPPLTNKCPDLYNLAVWIDWVLPYFRFVQQN